jgi:hypothetical protein
MVGGDRESFKASVTSDGKRRPADRRCGVRLVFLTVSLALEIPFEPELNDAGVGGAQNLPEAARFSRRFGVPKFAWLNALNSSVRN